MKQPNQRVCFQFGGFKNLVFEFHKARIKRTRGSESWFLSQWTVNRCVCVYICVYPWGSQTSQGSMQGHVWLQPVSFRILDSLQALVTLICLQTFLPSGGFHVYFSHLPFPHLPAYSPLFLLWRKDFWRPNQNTLWNTDTEKAKCSNDWQKLPFNSDSF